MSHHPLFIMDSYQLTQTSTMRCHGKMSELKANCNKISLTKSVTQVPFLVRIFYILHATKSQKTGKSKKKIFYGVFNNGSKVFFMSCPQHKAL